MSSPSCCLHRLPAHPQLLGMIDEVVGVSLSGSINS
jgi:hypothetical protein